MSSMLATSISRNSSQGLLFLNAVRLLRPGFVDVVDGSKAWTTNHCCYNNFLKKFSLCAGLWWLGS